MHRHCVVILPVEVGEWSVGEALEELEMRKRQAGRRGAGWEPAGSWKHGQELTKARSRGWGPWGRQGEQAVLADPPTPQPLRNSSPCHNDPSHI